MSNFTKTVLCILLIILFTSSVYGKKKIDASNKLVISFSKEGYGDVIAPSFFGSTSRQGEDKDIFWDEFNVIFQNNDLYVALFDKEEINLSRIQSAGEKIEKEELHYKFNEILKLMNNYEFSSVLIRTRPREK